jgi:hypothetical protein
MAGKSSKDLAIIPAAEVNPLGVATTLPEGQASVPPQKQKIRASEVVIIILLILLVLCCCCACLVMVGIAKAIALALAGINLIPQLTI